MDTHDRDDRIAHIARPEHFPPDEKIFPDRHGNTLLTYKYAAIRETFEECGLLLAAGDDGSPDMDTLKKLWEVRQHMSVGKSLFIDILKACKLQPLNDKLFYLTSFVTPEFSPIRFDAKFFFAPCPLGQKISIDETEIVDYTWATPSEAIKRNSEGSLSLAIPTLHIIQKFTRFNDYLSTIDGLFSGNQFF